MRAPDRRTGTFRSDAARRRFLAAYEHAFAALWPMPRSEGDVDTEFGTTHFHRCGSRTGVPIVLLHGATSNAVEWYPFVRALGAAHPVIALDTVGDPGRSTARVPIDEPVTSAAWLDQTFAGLSVDRAHLIGHSYGGWLALNQAVHAPERLVSVAALDPGGMAKVSRHFIASRPGACGVPLPGAVHSLVAGRLCKPHPERMNLGLSGLSVQDARLQCQGV